MPSLRVVLDTNVLVSGLASPGSIPGQIVAAWRQGAIDVVLSRYVLDKVARVLPRLNHRLHWDDADFTDLLEILAIQADLVEPQPLPPAAVRDAADVPVLGTFLAGLRHRSGFCTNWHVIASSAKLVLIELKPPLSPF